MHSNLITYKVYGRYALFTDPLTRNGGEKNTLIVPTYQALKGITESLYWKPTLIWRIKRVKILNPIRTETKGIRPIKYSGGNDLTRNTYLRDVAYLVDAYFVFNENRPDLSADFNENKHYFIAKRSLEKGGRRDIFLGTRECQAYIEPAAFDLEPSVYEGMGEMDLGFQYHSISYPDENNKQQMTVKFWHPKMVNGVIDFCQPEDCLDERILRTYNQKQFGPTNFTGLEESGLLDPDEWEKELS